MRSLLTTGLVLFCVVFAVFGLSVNGVWQTDHSTSLVQLDYALWHDHSFALTSATEQPPWSVDDFVHGGQNYSALAPGTAFLALPFLALGFTLAGPYTAFGPVLLLSEIFVALMGAVAAYLVYAIASLYFRRSTSIFLGFAFAFSTLLWPFATYFFQSDVSAAFVLLAVYLGLLALRRERHLAYSAFSGLAAGIAFTTDYVNGVLLPIMLVFLLLGKKGAWSTRLGAAGAFALGALPGFAAIGYYDWAIFGSPLVSSEQSYLNASSMLSSFTTSPAYGLGRDLFSPARGILVFSPILVLGVLGFIDGLRTKGRRLEVLLFLSVFLGVLLPYSMWYDPWGGISFGQRFLAAAVPFLLLPAGYVVDLARGRARLVVYALYLAGVVINGLGALVSAIPPITPFNVSPLTDFVIPNFLSGNLDAFWAGSVGFPSVAGAVLIGTLGGAIPLILVERSRRPEKGSNSGAKGPSIPIK